jgi:hypothetical protein
MKGCLLPHSELLFAQDPMEETRQTGQYRAQDVILGDGATMARHSA